MICEVYTEVCINIHVLEVPHGKGKVFISIFRRS